MIQKSSSAIVRMLLIGCEFRQFLTIMANRMLTTKLIVCIVKPFDRAQNDNSHLDKWNKYWGKCLVLVFVIESKKRNQSKTRIKRAQTLQIEPIFKETFAYYLLLELLMIFSDVLLGVRASSATSNVSARNWFAYVFAVAIASQMQTDTSYHVVCWLVVVNLLLRQTLNSKKLYLSTPKLQ